MLNSLRLHFVLHRFTTSLPSASPSPPTHHFSFSSLPSPSPSSLTSPITHLSSLFPAFLGLCDARLGRVRLYLDRTPLLLALILFLPRALSIAQHTLVFSASYLYIRWLAVSVLYS